MLNIAAKTKTRVKFLGLKRLHFTNEKRGTYNTYRTLMSRGMKGCYIFSDDEETRDWFRGI